MRKVMFARAGAAAFAALATAAAFGAPLKFDPMAWNASPLAWRGSGGAEATGTGGMAESPGPMYGEIEFKAEVTPVSREAGGWSILGIALGEDEKNFWHVALVAPPEEGKPHFIELSEMREGRWLSQYADGLQRVTNVRKAEEWKFGEKHRMRIRLHAKGVEAEVRNAAGDLMHSTAFAFPEGAKAVRRGRPFVRSGGGFRGKFEAMDAEGKGAVAKSEERKRFPKYESASFLAGVNSKATGFFRVERGEGGRWRAIDPLGRGFAILGVDHVKFNGHWSGRTGRALYREHNLKAYRNAEEWGERAVARLKDWGFNALGAGSDSALRHKGLVHTEFLTMGDALCRQEGDPELYICPNEKRPCSAFPNVFHPSFPAWCEHVARKKCAPLKEDPWLFGYFIDNELAWWGRGAGDTGLFDATMKLPEGHSAKSALREFLKSRGVKGAPSREDKHAFLRLAAEKYFATACAAIRRHDPNHLILGARFAGLGGADPVVWEVSGKYCDVCTFNCYPWADIERNVVYMDRRCEVRAADAFAERQKIVGRPVIITEWSFPALDSGLPCTAGAGQRFETQRQRTAATELFAKTMLSMPFVIGYDYFMWVDEPAAGISDAFPEDSNYGLVNEKDVAYPEITGMFKRLHAETRKWCDAKLPEEKAAGPGERTYAAKEFLAKKGGKSGAKYERKGAEFSVRSPAGLELKGRTGAARMLTDVIVGGKRVGDFNGMACVYRPGGGKVRHWMDAARVSDVSWREENGSGVLTVRSERRGGDFSFALTHEYTVLPDGKSFLCELVRAENLGKEPLEVRSFYFRQYSPFAGDRLKPGLAQVPNLWKAPKRDAWIAESGAYWGGCTKAPGCETFAYYFQRDERNGRQYPDAEFAPEAKLTIAPGKDYRPRGKAWMVAVAGAEGGVEAWRRVSRGTFDGFEAEGEKK